MAENSQLFGAIERGETEEAKRILSENRRLPIIGKGVGTLGTTVLQIAAWKGQTSLLDILYRRGADVNETDKLGQCALHYAAQRGNLDVVKWLLRHAALVNIKFVPSIVQCRLNKCCRLQPDISLATCASIMPCNGRQNYSIQEEGLNLSHDKLPFPDCWGRTPLHLSVKHNHPELSRILIEAGANFNEQDEQGVTPILLAGYNVQANELFEITKYAKIIQLLVSVGANVNAVHPKKGTTALHKACILGSLASVKELLNAGSNPLLQCYDIGSTAIHEAAAAGHLEIIRVLLSKIPSESINIRDNIGRTPLHRAAFEGHRNCVTLIIENGGSLSAKTKAGISTIDAIFAHVSQPVCLLEYVFDRAVNYNNTETGIIIDFNVLTPQKERQMSVISALINAVAEIEQLSLFQHPLLELFLKLKWNQLRIFFLMLVFVHVCFTLSASLYSTVLLKKSAYYDYLSEKILLFSSYILLLHNTVQMFLLPRYYLKQLETWLSFLCSTTSLLIILVGDNCFDEKCQASEWKLHINSIVILFSWIHLMLLVGRFPLCGYYALMFYTVLKNLLKVLLAFVWLIVGFALSFTVLFHKDEQFENWWKALAKTIVMMMGEYEYANMFAVQISTESFLLVTARIVFLVFVILASIVLMNLMIGLTVSDIQTLEQVGHIQRLLKQAEFVSHLERLTAHRIFRSKYVPKCMKKFIDSKRKISTKLIVNVSGSLTSSNMHISAEIAENLIEIAKKNKNYNDETDNVNNGRNSKSKFKKAIDDIRKQLHVIEGFKLKDNNVQHRKQLITLNLKRKHKYNASKFEKIT